MQIRRIAAVAVTITAGFAAHAGAAQAAYSIGPAGTNYVGTDAKDNSFTVNGARVTCATATFTGTANGTATTSFQPAYSGCKINLAGSLLNTTVTANGPWDLTVSQGPTSGVYGGSISLPSTSSVTINAVAGIPACVINVAGGQTFTNGTSGNLLTGRNSGSDAFLTADVKTITYTTSGCPGVTGGSNGRYLTAPTTTSSPTDGIFVPGVNVSGP